ncbi:MAG: apolipoprotein N-acyltransferase [Gammaproteobacteria bacterium]
MIRRFDSTWLMWAMAPLLGATQVFAFAPYGYSWLMPLTLAALFVSWLRRPDLAPWTGFLFGLGVFLHGVSWVYISIHNIGQAPVPLAVVLTLLFAVFLASFVALAGWIVRWGLGRRVHAIALIVLAWWLTEWLRSWLFTGFPWLLSGYGVAETPLAGWAPIFGVHGLSLAVVVTAACGAWGVLHARSARAIALISLPPLMLWGSGLALQSVTWTRPVGEPVSVALVQGNTEQVSKWRPEQRTAIMADYRRLTLPHAGARWIIWPETAIPLFLHQARNGFLAPLARELSEAGSTLLLGIPVYHQSDGRYFNGFVALDQSGLEQATYLKRHLVPFGEFIPLEWLIRPVMDWINMPMSAFSAGEPGQSFELDGVAIAVSICYEDIFPVEAAESARGSGVLVNVSNDGWFGRSAAGAQHQQMAMLRALENQRPMLRVSTTGVTSLIAFDGRVVKALPQHRQGVLNVSLQPRTGETPFQRWGNLPLLTLMGIASLVLIRLGLRRT